MIQIVYFMTVNGFDLFFSLIKNILSRPWPTELFNNQRFIITKRCLHGLLLFHFKTQTQPTRLQAQPTYKQKGIQILEKISGGLPLFHTPSTVCSPLQSHFWLWHTRKPASNFKQLYPEDQAMSQLAVPVQSKYMFIYILL